MAEGEERAVQGEVVALSALEEEREGVEVAAQECGAGVLL